MDDSRSVPLSMIGPVVTDESASAHTEAKDNDDSSNERRKVCDHVKKKWRNMFGVIKKRKQKIRKSTSGGNLKITESAGNVTFNRQSSLPAEYITVREYKHEPIYRVLMHNVLHPLGVPDQTVGLLPNDLLDHLREVFEIERDDHSVFITEELLNRPQNLQVRVTVMEANGLRGPDFTEDTSDTYCVIQLRNLASGKNLLIPRPSPNFARDSSPGRSPFVVPKVSKAENTVVEKTVVEKTSVVRNSSHPKWNEDFQMDLDDFLTDEVLVYMCNQELLTDASTEETKTVHKNSSCHIRKQSSVTEDEGILNSMSCIGKISIPVRNISSMGTDGWYDIVSPSTSRSKPKPVGKCHLRLGISYKQDNEESCYFSTEGYYTAFKQFLNHSYKGPSVKNQPHGDHGQLSLKAYRILKMFAEAHGISKLSQAIVNVTCLLEISCERDSEVNEYHICTALDDLQLTWATMQVGQKSNLDRMPLTDSELANYRRVANRFIQRKCEQLDGLPYLFPPNTKTIRKMKSKLGVTVKLFDLELCEPKYDPKILISKKVLEKLQKEVFEWMEDESLKIPESNLDINDKVVPEIQRLIDLINRVSEHCTVLPVNKQFHTSLGIDYYRVISIAAEDKICNHTIETIEKMKKYMKKYNSYSINILAASKHTLNLYFALRQFNDIIRDNITRRDFFRLTLFHYQEWFEEALIYWLHTFRIECINRIEKALEIEKEIVVVTSLVKYSHSSVDALSCFAQVIAEWKKIDFRDTDCVLMGVTQITDMICDGSRVYANKVLSKLERNCYFDDNFDAEFDVNDRLCIILNNIEHVRLYLGELPELLSWDTVVMTLSLTHGNEDVGTQATTTLQRLIGTCNEDILEKSTQLLQQIAGKTRADMEKYMEIFTRKEPFNPSSVDQILSYVSTNMQTLNDKLMPDIYPYMIEELWAVLLKSLGQQLLIGNKIEYYEQIRQHLQAIQTLFQGAGLDDSKIQSLLYDNIKGRLYLNTRKSEELMLLYNKGLVTDMGSPTERYGNLAFKAAFGEETGENVTIHVQVLRVNDLPRLDSSRYSDPYVEVSLQPEPFFAWCRPQKTHVVKQTSNAAFYVTFQFPSISKEYLNMEGASIFFAVYGHESFGRDTFAGEVVVPIQSLPKIDMRNSMVSLPAIIMLLKRPVQPLEGPFAILSQREWDKPSKTFISSRLRFMGNHGTREGRQKSSTQGLLASIFPNIFC